MEPLEKFANGVLDELRKNLPPHLGATVFIFEYGDNGKISFATTARKSQMVTVMEKWLRDFRMTIFKQENT